MKIYIVDSFAETKYQGSRMEAFISDMEVSDIEMWQIARCSIESFPKQKYRTHTKDENDISQYYCMNQESSIRNWKLQKRTLMLVVGSIVTLYNIN